MTIAERRQREKEQRREDILNAAETLFFSRGYDNVSMDEIANEVELSKRVLYYYFKDKESLFFAVANRGEKIFRATIVEEVKNVQDSGLMFSAINLAIAKFGQEHPDYVRAVDYFWSGRFDLLNEKDLSPDAKEIIKFTLDSYEFLLSVMKNGIEDGTFRSDINPLVVVILNNLIAIGIWTMNPYLRKFMEANGITMQQFTLEAINLANRMIMNTKEENEEQNKIGDGDAETNHRRRPSRYKRGREEDS